MTQAQQIAPRVVGLVFGLLAWLITLPIIGWRIYRHSDIRGALITGGVGCALLACGLVWLLWTLL